jgi:hypothetical protein
LIDSAARYPSVQLQLVGQSVQFGLREDHARAGGAVAQVQARFPLHGVARFAAKALKLQGRSNIVTLSSRIQPDSWNEFVMTEAILVH